ncbi:MAG: DUF2975 domain-containing protein [Bifidobacteriaceae bacterium]|jgi:hypothetical protein|nr:DUF2975 domain-containing protein [Bifidobacteriaceae bacterium]
MSATDRKAVGVVLEVALWLALVNIVVSGVIAPLVGLSSIDRPPDGSFWDQIGGSEHVEVELSEEGIAQALGPNAALPEGGSADLGDVTLTPKVTAQVTFARAGWADLLATVGSDLVFGICGTAACFLLWRVARTVRRGVPFEAANATRLYAAGLTCLAGGILQLLASAIGQFAVTAYGPLAGLTYMQLSLNLGWLPLGIVLCALGEVFRRGVALEADTKGLV